MKRGTRGKIQRFDSHWINTMYRCFTRPMRGFAGPLMVAACLAAAPSQAQMQRNFPPNALRGVILFADWPDILLNGSEARLAPGIRVRGQDNMLLLTGALPGAKVLVNYTFDMTGQVQNVWILRPEEAAMWPWPRTLEEAQTWSFDASTQSWTKP